MAWQFCDRRTTHAERMVCILVVAIKTETHAVTYGEITIVERQRFKPCQLLLQACYLCGIQLDNIFKASCFGSMLRKPFCLYIFPPYRLKQITMVMREKAETEFTLMKGERQSQTGRCVEGRNDQQLIPGGCNAGRKQIKAHRFEECLLIALPLVNACVCHRLPSWHSFGTRNGRCDQRE